MDFINAVNSDVQSWWSGPRKKEQKWKWPLFYFSHLSDHFLQRCNEMILRLVLAAIDPSLKPEPELHPSQKPGKWERWNFFTKNDQKNLMGLHKLVGGSNGPGNSLLRFHWKEKNQLTIEHPNVFWGWVLWSIPSNVVLTPSWVQYS